MIKVERGSTNVYRDLGYADADEMLVKARLASKIAEIIKGRGLTQAQAAEVLSMPRPKVSNMLNGRFRGISEVKMLGCLVRLGRDVRIVVKPARAKTAAGRVAVVFG